MHKIRFLAGDYNPFASFFLVHFVETRASSATEKRKYIYIFFIKRMFFGVKLYESKTLKIVATNGHTGI